MVCDSNEKIEDEKKIVDENEQETDRRLPARVLTVETDQAERGLLGVKRKFDDGEFDKSEHHQFAD